MNMLKALANSQNKKSLAARMRRRRFEFFLSLLNSLTERPVKILDIGGTQSFWETLGFIDATNVHITLLNLHPQPVRGPNFAGIVGNATDLSDFEDHQFDVIFSNSVIEHVGHYSLQQRMAQEVQRVGQRYFVQTPNYFFPIEPHFLVPGFQWLPVSIRVFLLRRFKLGWIGRVPDANEAQKLVESIQLLRKKDLLALFPGASLYEEKFLGLSKSFVVYDGW